MPRPTPDWHVIATTHGHQIDAEYQLAAAGWPVFCPLHLQRGLRKAEKIVPLFPGYIFVSWHPDRDWGGIKRIRYVWNILMSEPGKPSIVPVGVVEDLMRRSSPRRVVDDPLTHPNTWRPGQRVGVARGPLASLEGVCGLNPAGRVRLLFHLFNQPMECDVSAADLIAL
jgi:transcription antitermination factor NusG